MSVYAVMLGEGDSRQQYIPDVMQALHHHASHPNPITHPHSYPPAHPQSVEMAISKQWLKIDLSNNQFSNKCFSEVNYLGLCNEAPVDTNDGGLSGGAIFGIIVGVLAGVVLLALVVWVVVRKSRGGHLPMPSMPSLPSSKAAAFERFEDATPGPAMDGSGNTEGGPVPTSEGALVSEEPRQ